VSALPAELSHEDPCDPFRILADLPARERSTFLSEYRRRAEDAARDPEQWAELNRFLRLWSVRVIAVNRPGFYESQAAADAGTAPGMSLDEVLAYARANR
jgi:hypothetical protein